MRRIVSALMLLVLSSIPALADYDAGLMAFNRGDFELALDEWRPLAEQGHARAQYQIGTMYANGNGVFISLREALKYYQASAEQGLPEAQHALAFTYRVGNGVPKNTTEAAKWYRLAAEAGIQEAQFHLGSFYGGGEGVPRDYIQAYKWFSLAAAQGMQAARPAVFFCRDKLTRDQVLEAQRLAANWRPRK